MKVTISKDGKPRATVRVTFRVSIVEMVDAALRYDEDDPPSSRAEWIRLLNDALNSEGSGLWAYVEHVPNEQRAKFTSRCEELFPEFRVTQP